MNFKCNDFYRMYVCMYVCMQRAAQLTFPMEEGAAIELKGKETKFPIVPTLRAQSLAANHRAAPPSGWRPILL